MGIKIHEYPIEGTTIDDNSFIDVDQWNGVDFVSNKVKWSNVLLNAIDNIYTSNGTLLNNRTINADGNNLSVVQLQQTRFAANYAPLATFPSFAFEGYGTTNMDLTHVFSSQLGDALVIYGDLYKEFYGLTEFNGNIGVGIAPLSNRKIYTQAFGTDDAIYAASQNGLAGYFNSTNYRGIEVVGGQYAGVFQNTAGSICYIGASNYGAFGQGSSYGLYGDSASGTGVYASSASGTAIQAEGKTYLNGVVGIGINTPDSSAMVQIDSTTKGFLPPRMTGVQAEAIVSPAEGLMVYSTDGSGTIITVKGWWGWDGSTWIQF